MSKKTLVVFGATGHQGSSLIAHILSTPALSSTYTVRAVTRDPDAPAAKALAQNSSVAVVQADLADRASLDATLNGAHTLFYTTFPSWDASLDYAQQWSQGTAVADAAVAQGVRYIVYSTLPAVREGSGGKYARVTAFDVKADVERYIRGLPVQSAFVSLGSFMENFEEQFFLKPVLDPRSGKYVARRNHGPEIGWPLIDAGSDTGKFVGAILARPEKYEGKRLHCAAKVYKYSEVLALLAKSAGKEIVFERVSDEEFARGIPVLPLVFADAGGWADEFGYFGPGQEGLVKEAVEAVGESGMGGLVTFEEFLERKPFTLGE